jgi:glycine cleavage system pyridoxal-binding protein P
MIPAMPMPRTPSLRKIYIPSSNAKVEDAPSLVVPPTDDHPAIKPVVVSIDHREQFTIKQKFATSNICLSGFERSKEARIFNRYW